MFLIKFWIPQENHFERSKFRMVLLVPAQYYLDQHYQLVTMLANAYTDFTSCSYSHLRKGPLPYIHNDIVLLSYGVV